MMREAIKKHIVKRIAGKNVTPPKRGIGKVCIFRASGVSNSRLRNEIIKTRGMIIIPISREMTKPIRMNNRFSI